MNEDRFFKEMGVAVENYEKQSGKRLAVAIGMQENCFLFVSSDTKHWGELEKSRIYSGMSYGMAKGLLENSPK